MQIIQTKVIFLKLIILFIMFKYFWFLIVHIEGLSTRPIIVTNSDEMEIRIDPNHVDLDNEICGLYK